MQVPQLEAPHLKPAAPSAASAATIELSAEHSSIQTGGQTPAPEPDAPAEYAHLADVPLRLEAVLGRLTMNMRAVASLREGSVLTLNRSAGDNVDLMVAGVNLASGEIVVIEDALGVRITDLQTGE
jgi:flagellar motor switch protein FliN/FliY